MMIGMCIVDGPELHVYYNSPFFSQIPTRFQYVLLLVPVTVLMVCDFGNSRPHSLDLHVDNF